MRDEFHARPKSPGHPSETVIHHYEEDQTVLARWLQRGMQKGAGFWALVVGVIVVAVALMFFLRGLSAGDSVQHRAWIELMTAKTPEEQEEVAAAHPQTQAALWARLRAAEALVNEGADTLTTSRDAALPLLTRAHDQFEQIERAARGGALDDLVKRLAAMGMARAKEARGDLDAAVEQYKRVAETWPGTREAEQAERLAQELRQPEVVAFYEKLSAYKPPEVSLPPLNSGTSGLPPGHPPVDGSSLPDALTPDLLTPPPAPGAAPPLAMPPAPSEAAPAPEPRQPELELPQNPFDLLPPPAPSPAAEPPKPAPSGGELPGDVFAPSPK